jgi:hypothetical protein
MMAQPTMFIKKASKQTDFTLFAAAVKAPATGAGK